jgi:hypothetical protein
VAAAFVRHNGGIREMPFPDTGLIIREFFPQFLLQVFFPVSREFDPETGSRQTTHTAN